MTIMTTWLVMTRKLLVMMVENGWKVYTAFITIYVFEVDGYDERSTPPPWWLMWFYCTTFFFTTSFCLSNWQVRNRLESSLEVVGGEKSNSCWVTGGEYVQATCYTLDVSRSLQNWLRYTIQHINSATSGQSSMKKRPHIIILLADDLGWNEVSWNNPLFLTPNLEVRSSYI